MAPAVKAAPDPQISRTDPDARSMAASGRGTGIVGYNAQPVLVTTHHPIAAHEVTVVGNDRAHLTAMAREATDGKALTDIADRGYFVSEEIAACEAAGMTRLWIGMEQGLCRSLRAGLLIMLARRAWRGGDRACRGQTSDGG
jgi:hypothetical protein